MVCTREVSDLRNPSLSASRIATRVISGISRPSLSRLMPTSTSNTSRRISLMISARSRVSISEWRYLTLTPFSARYSVRSSAIRFVSVVTRTLFLLPVSFLISARRSSIWPSVGLTSTSGSRRPVGLMTCSALSSSCSCSYLPGVAEQKSIWSILASNSSKFRGLLSRADGSLKP